MILHHRLEHITDFAVTGPSEVVYKSAPREFGRYCQHEWATERRNCVGLGWNDE